MLIAKLTNEQGQTFSVHTHKNNQFIVHTTATHPEYFRCQTKAEHWMINAYNQSLTKH